MSDKEIAEIEYAKIVKYVNAAADLAEAIQKDIKKSDRYTTETIHALAKFFRASKDVTKFIDMVEKDSVKLN